MGSLGEGLESFPKPATNRKRIIVALTVDFYCKQVNAIDFVSAVTSKTSARRGTLSFPPVGTASLCLAEFPSVRGCL